MATTRTDPSAKTERGALTARVSLGTVFTPVPSEFLLIASTALLLTVFGLVMVLSATSAQGGGDDPFGTLLRQGMFAMLGIPLMFLASRVKISFWKKIAWPLLGFALLFQALIYTPLAVHADGNTAWISIAGVQAQPAEFLKLAFALWLGLVLSRKHTLLANWKHVFIPVVPVAIVVLASVLGGRDLGTGMILVLIVLGALFFAGVKLRLFILPAIAAVAVVIFLAVTDPNRMGRIFAQYSSDCDYYGDCYQAIHGVWGLARGGIFGLGLGNSKEKYDWLPAAANDYIFAIVGEELGLIGCIVVLALFALFAVGAFHVIRKTRDPFVRVVSGAVTIWIVGQALINIGVVLRIFPVLGVPLPFMSQGGTSLIAVLVAVGVLLSFARTLPEHAAVAPTPPAAGRSRRPR